MKRCDFCDHCGRTDKNEEVCTKRLIYVGDLEHYYPCDDFEISVDAKHLGLVLLVLISSLITLFTIFL